MTKRFDHIEGPGEGNRRPAEPPSLTRFEFLEIGEISMPCAPAPKARALCRHCGQGNEEGRELCWACHKTLAPVPLAAPAPVPEEVVQIMLDGKTYLSNDPSTPQDVMVLMDRIKKEGYSPRLLSEWRQWRATRNALSEKDRIVEQMDASRSDVKIFRGQRVSVVRVDGHTYTSDMKDLPPEIKSLFDYLRFNEVTPELMDHLRRHGAKVKFRPFSTPDPTDGEMSFWKAAGDALKGLMDG